MTERRTLRLACVTSSAYRYREDTIEIHCDSNGHRGQVPTSWDGGQAWLTMTSCPLPRVAAADASQMSCTLLRQATPHAASHGSSQRQVVPGDSQRVWLWTHLWRVAAAAAAALVAAFSRLWVRRADVAGDGRHFAVRGGRRARPRYFSRRHRDRALPPPTPSRTHAVLDPSRAAPTLFGVRATRTRRYAQVAPAAHAAVMKEEVAAAAAAEVSPAVPPTETVAAAAGPEAPTVHRQRASPRRVQRLPRHVRGGGHSVGVNTLVIVNDGGANNMLHNACRSFPAVCGVPAATTSASKSTALSTTTSASTRSSLLTTAAPST